MIKLDPDEEAEDDEDKPLGKTPVKQVISPNQLPPNTSNMLTNDATVNNVHLNNVQINLTRVNLPPDLQNFVSSIIFI